MLGVEYDSTFDYTSYSSSNSNYGSDDTADAKNIAVSWWQDEWFVQPKVSIEWHPLHNKLFIGVNANFFVPISEIAQINLTQNDGGSQSANSKSFSLTRADVKLNNRTQPATPYAFRGLQLGVSLGYGGFVKDAVKQ